LQPGLQISVCGITLGDYMKQLLLLLAIIGQCAFAKGQFVFRNAGPDTLRIAIGTFYDSTSKGVKQEAFHKAIITKGWYRLYPGDSIVAGALFGPAVYYLAEHIQGDHYILGEPEPRHSGNLRENYREPLLTDHNGLKDTAKFIVKHPFGPVCSTSLIEGSFHVMMIPELAKRQKRLLIEIDRRPKKG
jgi:hypothetical protein